MINLWRGSGVKNAPCVFLGKRAIQNLILKVMKQNQNLGAGAFRSPHPSVFCGGVQVGMSRVPWQKLLSILRQGKERRELFPEPL